MHRSPQGSTALVGREGELATLVEHLERARDQHGTLLLLAGNAGVGKTRLLRALKREARARDARVVEGRCSSAESSLPYAPLMDALRFRIARGEGEEAARLLGPLKAILAPLFPSLDDSARSARESAERPFELICHVLDRLAAEDPLLLILEDIHWADQTTLELLQYLAHRARGMHLLLIATYRSDEVHAAHPLRRLLATLARERSAVDLRLDPLSRDETMELLRGMLGREPDPAFAAAIWRRSEGNPFFVEELVAASSEGSGTALPAGTTEAPTRLPTTISEAVLSRVYVLGAAAQEALSAAAVIGRRVEFDLLREVLDVSEETLVELLEEIHAHQLLVEEHGSGGEWYSFPHTLMLEAIYESLISRRRRLLHRRIAEALDRLATPTPSRLDELAYHFRLGGQHDRAYEYARRAGDEAGRLRAWDDAAAHYEHALASLEEIGAAGQREAELLELLGDVAWQRSRVEQATQYLEDALRLRRESGDVEATARLLRRRAALRFERGDYDAAAAALEEAVHLLCERPDSVELAAIQIDLGRVALHRGELARAEHLLSSGLRLASRDAAGAEEVLALVSLGELGLVAGRIDCAVARLEVAREILREGRLPFHRAMRAYASSVRTLILGHEYDRALEWIAAARKRSQEQEAVGIEALFRALRMVVLAITSPEAELLSEAQAAVKELRHAARAELRDGLRVLGFVHRTRGELAEARAAYAEAAALGEREAATGVALVTLAEGRAAAAADALLGALRAVPAGEPLLTRRLLPPTVEALVAAGRVDEAEALVGGEPVPDDPRAGGIEMLYASGLVELARHRPAAACERLARAAEQADAVGSRRDAVRVRTALVEALLALGATDDAVTLGRRLLEATTPTWLPLERERVRRLLRRAGVRTRPVRSRRSPGDRSGVDALTPRERAVLAEIARGRTNRQIADALGIAEKTASVHVSSILSKLGARTRTEAARFAPMVADANGADDSHRPPLNGAPRPPLRERPATRDQAPSRR